MTAKTRSLAFGVSVASLALVLGIATSSWAQDKPTEVVLPPLPEVTVDLSQAKEPAPPTKIDETPAPTPAPATAEISPAAPAGAPEAVQTLTRAPEQAPPALAERVATPAPEQPPAQEPVAAEKPVAESPEKAETAAIPAAPSPAEAGAATQAAPAQAQAPAPEAAPPLDLSASVKEALDGLSREPARSLEQRREREAIVAFYAARGNAPLWRDASGWSATARSVLTRLEHADEDALDLKATPLPTLGGRDPAALGGTDVALSLAVVNYARQAGGSRVDPLSISRLITDRPELADAASILTGVSGSTEAGATLQAYNPDHEGYRLLRAKLAELRQENTAPVAHIDPGPILKVGMKDPRVPLIRAHFRIGADPGVASSDDLVYDTRVASAVADFQRANGLPASGQLTPRTIAVLSGGEPVRLKSEIIANMERWRWMAHSEAPDRIEVNVPDYSVRVYRGGDMVHSARTIVGKPTTPTPIFSNRMQFIEVNPYWNVPDSIIKKEMLPKLAADPTYLQRMGYEVTTRNGRMVVRQPPGERNALGRIKFMFPNQHAVYLHDTPTRNLFKTDRRAYSHGCVRVDQPFKLAEIVLGKDTGWSEDRVKKLIGGANRTIRLPKPIDIHIGYFTAFVDESGRLQLRDDIYGYSHKLKAALGLQG